MSEIDLSHLNRYTVQAIAREANTMDSLIDNIDKTDIYRASRQVMREADNRILNLWNPHSNDILYNRLRGLEYALQREGITDLPNIWEVIDDSIDRASAEDVDGWTRDARLHYHHLDVIDRVQNADLEERLIQNRQNTIDDMDNGGSKNLAQTRLNRRRDIWLHSKLKIGYYKRLMFAEAMRQTQIAQVVYLEHAGFYYVRWNLSPTHPKGDICDVYARHVWLSPEDQDSYYDITGGDVSFGGLMTLANLDGDLILPELEDWSDSEIAHAVRQYSRHNSIDPRRKRAGYKPPHPMCKCYVNPVLESRV